ncbi:peroxiredoxin-like family protein [Amycolatopsis sp. PS_44_ISF1]|uniref:peroxiredoxin-like family protein n=1 Tax=Amycolatopsis sp. PS_44_ISF1 TaxID=2974917 RepID=UPI0028DE3DE4|nr:peroxiredoxin-like family protein [Amycolatopsis sp. PS_44_ISF1]MDT8914473.1 AhpC/TSA family protein [Amycolatopsis sp. PS_44_ISF1]
MTTDSPTPTIATETAALAQGISSRLPAEVLATFAAEQSALDQAGVPGGVVTAGTKLPDGELLDAHGSATSLAAVRDGRPAVIAFYRGAWCPYCNIALRVYQSSLVGELTRRGAVLIAISPQAPDGSLSMREKNDLTFPVLSDPGNAIAARLGILTAPTDAVRAAQARLGVDVAAGNADGTATLPMPTLLVVDADGTIQWIDVTPDYTARTEAGDVLAAFTRTIG